MLYLIFQVKILDHIYLGGWGRVRQPRRPNTDTSNLLLLQIRDILSLDGDSSMYERKECLLHSQDPHCIAAGLTGYVCYLLLYSCLMTQGPSDPQGIRKSLPPNHGMKSRSHCTASLIGQSRIILFFLFLQIPDHSCTILT